MEAQELLKAAASLIRAALAEDIGPGDVTTQAVIPEGREGNAVIVAKAYGVLAGLPIAEGVFREVAPQIRFEPLAQDGEPVAPGDVVAQVSGPLRGILTAERVALNFLCRLSGIATLTAKFVDAVVEKFAITDYTSFSA